MKNQIMFRIKMEKISRKNRKKFFEISKKISWTN